MLLIKIGKMLNGSWTALTLLKKIITMKNAEIKRMIRFTKKGTLPILTSSALIENGFAISDNLEMRLQVKTDIKGNGVIDLTPLSKIKSYDSAEIKDGFLWIKNGKSVSKFALVGNVDDFPIKTECNKVIGALHADDVTAMQSVVPFVANDIIRPALTGVYFDENNIVGTNAHILRWLPKKSELKAVIIPGEYVKYFKNTDYAVLQSEDGRYLEFISPEETLTVKVIEGMYPAWKNVVPTEHPKSVTIPTKEFITALNNALPSANSNTNAVALTFKDNELTISACDVDKNTEYTESLAIGMKPEFAITIGFNAKLLLSGINSTNLTTLMTLSESNRACIFNENTLIMPCMIENDKNETARNEVKTEEVEPVEAIEEVEPVEAIEEVEPIEVEPIKEGENNPIEEPQKIGKTGNLEAEKHIASMLLIYQKSGERGLESAVFMRYSGDHNKAIRQIMVSHLKGEAVPKAKAGVNFLLALLLMHFEQVSGVKSEGNETNIEIDAEVIIDNSDNESAEESEDNSEEDNEDENPKQTASEETITEILALIDNVTEKSFGIVGYTEIIPEEFLKKYGCKCKLTYNNKRRDGYIFSKKRREEFLKVMQENGLMFTLKIAS